MGDTLQAAFLDYTNYRGERRWRHVLPLRLWYGTTEWHAAGWLLDAIDLERDDRPTGMCRS